MPTRGRAPPRATGQTPYVIRAFQIAGQTGLGRDGRRFALAQVEREMQLGAEDWEPVYPAGRPDYLALPAPPPRIPGRSPDALRIVLETPLRIKRNGRFVGAAELDARDLLRALCARVELLALHHGGNPDPFRWPHLAARSETLSLSDRRVRWHERTRYSSRQGTAMQLGGLVGELILKGQGLAAFWPALWYGQWVHLGKGTGFGLCRYCLEPL
jgi:hypothetical protein